MKLMLIRASRANRCPSRALQLLPRVVLIVIFGALLSTTFRFHALDSLHGSASIDNDGNTAPRENNGKEDAMLAFDEEFMMFSRREGDKNWLYFNGTGKITNISIAGKETPIRTRFHKRYFPYNKIKIPTREYVMQKVLERHNGTVPQSSFNIDRIYYINLDSNYERKFLTESWLKRTNLPYERAPGLTGGRNECVKTKNGDRCIGISGLIKSNFNIMDNFNTTGITLVLEDDFVIRDMKKLMLSVHLVPSDWDVLRWDCWGPQPASFNWMSEFSFRAGPIMDPFCSPCPYCGGTHATMWRDGDSLKKLRKVWSKTPYNDIDARLVHPSLKSYCINVGVGELRAPVDGSTNIPKQGSAITKEVSSQREVKLQLVRDFLRKRKQTVT